MARIKVGIVGYLFGGIGWEYKVDFLFTDVNRIADFYCFVKFLNVLILADYKPMAYTVLFPNEFCLSIGSLLGVPKRLFALIVMRNTF
jgi:hypothetical protein